MKVQLEPYLWQLSGKRGDLVYCCNREQGGMYARRYVYPRLGEHNHRMGSATARIHALQPSEAYRLDLKDYLWQLCREHRYCRVRSWSGLYVKLMYALAKADPTVDLGTLSREEIYARDLPCRTVKRAVEAGLLPEVRGYQAYTAEM